MNVGAVVLLLTTLVAPAALPPHQSASPVRRAAGLIDAGEIDAALELLRELVRERPADPRIRYELARALHEAGGHEAALEQLTIGLPTATDRGAYHLLMARALIDLDRLRSARDHLEAAEAERPDYPPIGYQRARICHRAGNAEAALAALERVIRLAPRWETPRSLAVEIALERGDVEEATRWLADLLQIGDSAPALWIRYGDLLAARSQTTAAEEAYRTALARSGDGRLARLALAYFLFNERRFVEADTTLDELATNHPDDPAVLLPRAEIAMLDGRLEEALDMLERALAKMTTANERVRAQRLRAQVLLALRRYPEAARAARRAMNTDPTELEARFTLGTALLRAGDPDGRAELETYRQLAEAREHREMATDFLQGEDAIRAEREYRRALELVPEDPAALQGLGAALRLQGRFAEAITALAAAANAGAEGPAWAHETMLTLHGAGRTDDALRLRDEARLRGWPLRPEVRAALGEESDACR